MNLSGLSTQLNSAENNRLQGTSNRAVARSAAPEAERYRPTRQNTTVWIADSILALNDAWWMN